jgi:hypothetical protein
LRRKAEKRPCLIENVTETIKAAGFGDQIQQIAMFAGGRVGLMFNCT